MHWNIHSHRSHQLGATHRVTHPGVPRPRLHYNRAFTMSGIEHYFQRSKLNISKMLLSDLNSKNLFSYNESSILYVSRRWNPRTASPNRQTMTSTGVASYALGICSCARTPYYRSHTGSLWPFRVASPCVLAGVSWTWHPFRRWHKRRETGFGGYISHVDAGC